MKAKFALELIDRNRQRPVHRGTTYPAPFIVKRDEGFTGEIMLQMAAQQSRHRQGITGPILSVPSNVERVSYPCFMPQWLETDRTTRMSVMGVAKQADPKGKVRHVMKAAAARVTMIMEGALLGVSSKQTELTAQTGKSFQIPFEIVRSRKLPVEVTVDLVVPEELKQLVTSEAVQLAPDVVSGTLTVTTVNKEQLRGDWTLQLRASAMEDDRWPVNVVADVPVRIK